MANWCLTEYKCVGDPKEVREIYKALESIDQRNTTIEKNSFGKWWIGNLVKVLSGDCMNCNCRGKILNYSLSNNILTITQSTAWEEQKGVRQIIEEKFPRVKVYYRESEANCEIYNTNDLNRTYFPEQYLIENNNEPIYFRTIEDVAEWASNLVGRKVEANMIKIQKALDEYAKVQGEPEDYFYDLREFQIVED